MLWISTNNGMYYYDGNEIHKKSNLDGLFTNDIIKIKVDHLNYTWPVGFDNQVNYIYNDKVKAVKSVKNLNLRHYSFYWGKNNDWFLLNDTLPYYYNLRDNRFTELSLPNKTRLLSIDQYGRMLLNRRNFLFCYDYLNNKIVFSLKGDFSPLNKRFENTILLTNQLGEVFKVEKDRLKPIPNADYYLNDYANPDEVKIIRNDTLFELKNNSVQAAYKLSINTNVENKHYPKICCYNKTLTVTYKQRIEIIKDYTKFNDNEVCKVEDSEAIVAIYKNKNDYTIIPKYQDAYTLSGEIITNNIVTLSSFKINDSIVLISHQKGIVLLNLFSNKSTQYDELYSFQVIENTDSVFYFLNQGSVVKMHGNQIDVIAKRQMFDRYSFVEKIDNSKMLLLTEQDSLFTVDSSGRFSFLRLLLNVSDIKTLNDSIALVASPTGLMRFNFKENSLSNLGFNQTFFKIELDENHVFCIGNDDILILNKDLTYFNNLSKFSFDENLIKYATLFDSLFIYIKGDFLFEKNGFDKTDLLETPQIKINHPALNNISLNKAEITPQSIQDHFTLDVISLFNNQDYSIKYCVNNQNKFEEVVDNKIDFNVKYIDRLTIKIENKFTHQELIVKEVLFTKKFSFLYLWSNEIIIILALILFVYASVISVSFIYKKKQQRLLEQAKSDLKVLQLQMNPHFLYNSLNTFQGLIFKSDKLFANKFLISLNNLFRYYFNYSEKLYISLEDELLFIREYISVQKIRFENVFEYEEHIDLKDYKLNELFIPSMIIQPMVENSIHHGFKNITTGGKVDLSIIEDAKFLTIKIKDNGGGFDLEKKEGNDRYNATEVIKKKIDIINRNNKLKAKFNVTNTENGVVATIKLNKKLCLKPL